MKKRHYNQKGFTLVEMMVALTLFVIVTIAATSTLFTVTSTSRKAEALRSTMDNLNFAIEAISRNVRTSTTIICGGQVNILSPNCPFESGSPSSLIAMTSSMSGGAVVEYRLAVNGTRGVIERRVGADPWVAVTAPEIDVDVLEFYVDGASTSDSKQPVVTVFIGGAAILDDTLDKFSVQTMISQRSAE